VAASNPITNWKEYNLALKNRAAVTMWVDDLAIQKWYSQKKSKRGAPRLYGDAAITCALTVRSIFRLPLRQTEGFLRSIFSLMGLDLEVPCYTTLSRRSCDLSVEIPTTSTALHIVIDSTGLKVYGEGEWKTRQYGYSKRRTWRKLHLSIDPASHEILSTSLTGNGVHDSEMLPKMICDEAQAEAIYGDGAYDTSSCYDAIQGISARPVIPPRRGARIKQHGNLKAPPHPRDVNLRMVRDHGRKAWKRETGYHRRSLGETAMFRFKTVFGDRLASRSFHAQATEVFIKARALNIITSLGMPNSQRSGLVGEMCQLQGGPSETRGVDSRP